MKKRSPPMRKGTMDKQIYQMTVENDEYGLLGTAEYDKGDVFVDIGAHVGYVSAEMLYRGVGFIFAFEIHPDNFKILRRHIGDLSEQVSVHKVAVWKSGADLDTEFEVHPSEPWGPNANTGAPTVAPRMNRGVARVGIIEFDTVITIAQNVASGKVIVKIDAEHSEWPCLLTSENLGLIDLLVGEYHVIPHVDESSVFYVAGYDKFYWRDLELKLTGAGFNHIDSYPIREDIGIFRAKRVK